MSQRQQRLTTELTLAVTDGPVANHCTDHDQTNTHVCRFIWEWTSAQQINLSSPKGYLEGDRGSHIHRCGKDANHLADQDQIWHTYAYSSGNGHELKKYNPLIPEWHGGVRGSSIHKSGKATKPLERSGPNLAHIIQIHQGIDIG